MNSTKVAPPLSSDFSKLTRSNIKTEACTPDAIFRGLIGNALAIANVSESQQRAAVRTLQGVAGVRDLLKIAFPQTTGGEKVDPTVVAEVRRSNDGSALDKKNFEPEPTLDVEALFREKTRGMYGLQELSKTTIPAMNRINWLQDAAKSFLAGSQPEEAIDSNTLIYQLNSTDSEIHQRCYSEDYPDVCGGMSSSSSDIKVSVHMGQKCAAILLSGHVDDQNVVDALFEKAFDNACDEALGRVCCWALRGQLLAPHQIQKLYEIVAQSEHYCVIHDATSIEGRAEYLLNAQLNLLLNKETP